MRVNKIYLSTNITFLNFNGNTLPYFQEQDRMITIMQQQLSPTLTDRYIDKKFSYYSRYRLQPIKESNYAPTNIKTQIITEIKAKTGPSIIINNPPGLKDF